MPKYRRQGAAFRALVQLDIASRVFDIEFPDLPACVASGGDDFVHAPDRAKRPFGHWIHALHGRARAVPVPAACRDVKNSAGHAVWISSRSGFEQARRSKLSPSKSPKAKELPVSV
jgi:hypothetical protein